MPASSASHATRRISAARFEIGRKVVASPAIGAIQWRGRQRDRTLALPRLSVRSSMGTPIYVPKIGWGEDVGDHRV
jgi:hypothetical protein